VIQPYLYISNESVLDSENSKKTVLSKINTLVVVVVVVVSVVVVVVCV
jgi:hypothetical protein